MVFPTIDGGDDDVDSNDDGGDGNNGDLQGEAQAVVAAGEARARFSTINMKIMLND